MSSGTTLFRTIGTNSDQLEIRIMKKNLNKNRTRMEPDAPVSERKTPGRQRRTGGTGTAALAAAALLLLLSCCTKFWNPAGREIRFESESGGYAGLSASKVSELLASLTGSTTTKTVFSDSTYSDSGVRYERIDWSEGDVIRVYSAQALMGDGTTHYADYTVTGVDNSGAYSRGSLRSTAANGLQWGTQQEHLFYAMYPSPGNTGGAASEPRW